MRLKSVDDYQAQFTAAIGKIYAKGANDQHFNTPINPELLQDPKSEILLHEIMSLVLYAVFYMVSAYMDDHSDNQFLWQKILGVEHMMRSCGRLIWLSQMECTTEFLVSMIRLMSVFVM